MRHLLLAGLVSVCTLAAQPQAGAGLIEGHVLNALTGEPLRKATVTLTAPQILLVDNTDAAGKFQFTGLPPGTYRLSASHAGFLDHAARRPVSLGANQEVADSEIRLPPQGVIAGRILDEDDDPAPGATVSIFKQIYREGGRQWDQLNVNSIANDAGEYRFAGLRPGRYILRARYQRETSYNRFGDRPKAVYSPIYPAYYPNASSQQAAAPVEVGLGADVRDIDIHLFKHALAPFFHVRGKVAGAPGSSIIAVSLHGGDDCSGDATARPPDYAFDLTSGPGQCTIVANVYDSGPEAYASGSLTVTGDITGVVVSMTPAAIVTGRITLAESSGQAKLQGVRVNLRDPVHGAQDARSDATGKLAFDKPVPPGHYSMKVVSRTIPDGYFIRDVKLGGRRFPSTTSRFKAPHNWNLSSATPRARSKARYRTPMATRSQFRPLHSFPLTGSHGRRSSPWTTTGIFSSPACGPASTTCSPGRKWTMTCGKIPTSGKSTRIAPRKSLRGPGKHRTCSCA